MASTAVASSAFNVDRFFFRDASNPPAAALSIEPFTKTKAEDGFKFVGPSGATVQLKNVKDPTLNQDVATKKYVDDVSQGLDVKDSCIVALETNETIANLVAGVSKDGIELSTNDRVLLKGQTDGKENGVYVVPAAGTPARAEDFAAAAVGADPIEAKGYFTFVEQGTHAGQGFVVTGAQTTIGTHALTFTQFSGAGSIVAGTNLSKAGSTISTVANPSFATSVTVGTLKMEPAKITDTSGTVSFDTSDIETTGKLKGGTDSTIGNLTLGNGSIVDSSKLIDFSDTALTTTGILTAPANSKIGTLTFAASGSITDDGGAISFGSNTVASGAITVGTTTFAGGSITDTGGTISFGDDNITSTGTLTAATGSSIGNLTLADGSITDTSNAITFGSAALTAASYTCTSGAVTCGSVVASGDVGCATVTATGALTCLSANVGAGAGALACGVLDAATNSTIGNLTLGNGSIVDSSKLIDFSDTALTTTGILTAPANSKIGTLTFAASGTITDDGGAISFGSNTVASGAITVGRTTYGNGTITDSNNAISFGNATLTAQQYNASSDRRLKQGIEYVNPIDSLREVMHMRAATYEFKSTPGVKRQGVIAQDLLPVAPHLVTKANKGCGEKEHLAVNYIDMISSLVGAVQALQAQLDEQREELCALKKKMAVAAQ